MRLILGISGASGAILGIEVLKALKQIKDCELHLVITHGAEKTIALETGLTIDQLGQMGGILHPIDNLGASIASGSFRTDGMVVVPCSMKTVAGIATGYSDNLLLRAADVCLKEKRKLVLVPRDAPLSGIHLRNLLTLSQEGCTIIPAMMTFYHNPKSIQEMIDQLVGKILMQFDLDYNHFKPWAGI